MSIRPVGLVIKIMVSVPVVKCNIYADDTAIYFSGTTIDTVCYKLQEAVNQALNWFKSNKLTINATKSYTMLILIRNSHNIHHDASLNRWNQPGTG